jgi:hypothetical protein
VQVWAQADIEVSPLHRRLIAELAPRVLSRLATDWHQPAGKATDFMSTGHVAEVAATLGMLDEVVLLRLENNLTIVERSAVIEIMKLGMEKLTTEVGLDWDELWGEVEKEDAMVQAGLVRVALVLSCCFGRQSFLSALHCLRRPFFVQSLPLLLAPVVSSL